MPEVDEPGESDVYWTASFVRCFAGLRHTSCAVMNRPSAPALPDTAGPLVQYDRLLDEMVGHLNAVHGTSRSRRYWAILLHRYLRRCLTVHAAGLLDRDVPAMPAADDRIEGPRIGAGDARPDVRQRLRPVINRMVWRAKAAYRLVRGREYRSRFAPYSFRTAQSVLAGFHYTHIISKLVDQPSAWFWPSPLGSQVSLDRSKRAEVNHRATTASSSLVRLALEWLPRWYVEEFAAREARVDESAGGRFVMHAAFLPDPAIRYFVARHVEEGGAFIMYQHAATYGEITDDVPYHSETYLGDRFRTWGWKIGPKDSPFLALRLMKPEHDAITRVAPSDEWLYVVVADPYPWFLPRTLDTQERFFARLKPALAQRMIMRPRTQKGGSVAPQVTDRSRAAVGMIDNGTHSWTPLASRVELVVLDSFPTTLFLECVKAGIPVVAIVPPTVAFTELATPFYEQFAAAGVLHHSPESAAEFLNGCVVQDWWRDVQQAPWLREYLALFCRTELPSGAA